MQELRDIATTEAVKGKHFFLESDIKGPALKLDNTGKAILTVSDYIFVSLLYESSTFFFFWENRIVNWDNREISGLPIYFLLFIY